MIYFQQNTYQSSKICNFSLQLRIENKKHPKNLLNYYFHPYCVFYNKLRKYQYLMNPNNKNLDWKKPQKRGEENLLQCGIGSSEFQNAKVKVEITNLTYLVSDFLFIYKTRLCHNRLISLRKNSEKIWFFQNILKWTLDKAIYIEV